MATLNEKFKSEFGFESPEFTVTQNGRVTAAVLDVQAIRIAGVPFVGTEPVDPTDPGAGDGGDQDTGGETPSASAFPNLKVDGPFEVYNATNFIMEAIDGILKIKPQAIGSMDNVDIGLEEPGQARVYSLELTSAPDSTASVLKVNNTRVEGEMILEDGLKINNPPVEATDGTNKSYVDATASALAIAFGV